MTPDIDWANFWAGTVAAAAIATAVTTFVTLALQRRKRPTADWALAGTLKQPDPGQIPDPTGKRRRFLLAELRNAGDGTAFGVHVTDGAYSEIWTPPHKPGMYVVAPGETITVNGWITQEDFWDATVKVTWLASPTRLQKWWEQELAVVDYVGMDDDHPLPTPKRRPRPKRVRLEPPQPHQLPPTMEMKTLERREHTKRPPSPPR